MKQDGILRVVIIGTGWIAEKAAITLNRLTECEAYAVGSRTLEKALAFAKQWNIARAYGSYGELISDPDIDLMNFVRMFFPSNIINIESLCVKSKTGMDLTNAITLVLEDGMLCNLQSSAACVGDNIGVIAGTEGNLIIDNINNPQKITVNGPNRTYIDTIHVPQQITGYEYQFLACREALMEGLLEPREMPHDETLYIMQIMDSLRQKWGVHYPMDDN